MTKPVAAASKDSGQKLPRKPSQSRIRSTAPPRGELFCSAADSVLALSVTCGDSSPKGRALGKTKSFAVLPKPLPLGEVAATGGSRRRGRGCCPQPCRWRSPLKPLPSGEGPSPTKNTHSLPGGMQGQGGGCFAVLRGVKKDRPTDLVRRSLEGTGSDQGDHLRAIISV